MNDILKTILPLWVRAIGTGPERAASLSAILEWAYGVTTEVVIAAVLEGKK